MPAGFTGMNKMNYAALLYGSPVRLDGPSEERIAALRQLFGEE